MKSIPTYSKLSRTCRQLGAASALSLMLMGCGDWDSNNTSTENSNEDTSASTASLSLALEDNNSDAPSITLNGAGIKGPLANAEVAAYLLDPSQMDLKGQRISLGLTDELARLDLSVPAEYAGQGPFLIEYSGGNELNGETPSISVLTTLLTNEQLNNGTAVYATPLTSFVIAHAYQIADRSNLPSNPIQDGLLGDNNGTVSLQEFLAALQTSSNAMKSTLGLGLLSEQMDIFTTSPLLDGSQSSDESFAIRYTNEVFAALVGKVATAVSNSALPLSGVTVVKTLAQDFSDGVFDSMAWVNNDGVASPIGTFADVDIASILETNPEQLTIPGTSTAIADLSQFLMVEASLLDLNTPIEPSQTIDPVPLLTTVFDAPAAPATTLPVDPVIETPTINSAPIIGFDTPSINAGFDSGSLVYVKVNATDSDGSVQKCSLSIDGVAIRDEYVAPYEWGTTPGGSIDSQFAVLTIGNHNISVTCIDNNNASSTIERSLVIEATLIIEPEPEAPVVIEPEPEAPVVAEPEPEVPVVIEPEPEVPVVIEPEPEVPVVIEPEPEVPVVIEPEPEVPVVIEPEPTFSNVLLDWVVPTTREDGSVLPMSEIASYEIYYYLNDGTTNGTSVSVAATNNADALVTSFQLNNLTEGDYFFSIATVDTQGNVSEFVEPIALSI
jgi:hypothetical protein